jgi:hypothetical protein
MSTDPDKEGKAMNEPKERRSSLRARFSGDQLAVAGVVAALILLILVLASALFT